MNGIDHRKSEIFDVIDSIKANVMCSSVTFSQVLKKNTKWRCQTSSPVDLCWSLFTPHHVAKDKDVRTDEIVTFLEDCFTRIVLGLIANTEDRSLKRRQIEQESSSIGVYKAKDPKEHAPPMSSNDNPKPRTKCGSKHSKSKHSRSDQE